MITDIPDELSWGLTYWLDNGDKEEIALRLFYKMYYLNPLIFEEYFRNPTRRILVEEDLPYETVLLFSTKIGQASTRFLSWLSGVLSPYGTTNGRGYLTLLRRRGYL